jgi:hypothetical protein
MKNSTMRLMIAAAALAVAAGSASAQTYKAEIPVAFRAGGNAMLPGTYQIRREVHGGGPIVHVYNLDSQKHVVLLTSFGSDAPKGWRAAGTPMIALECVEGRCALRSLWTGSGPAMYSFPGSISRGQDDKVAMMLVTLTSGE